MRKIEYNNNKNVIFKQLKMARRNAGLSQTEIAARMQIHSINIDQQAISKIERNLRIVTDYELACFCKILGIEERELLRDFYGNQSEPAQT